MISSCKSSLNSLPHHIKIDVKIIVNQTVTHVDDIIPWNDVCSVVFNGFGNFRSCFTDYFNRFNYLLKC